MDITEQLTHESRIALAAAAEITRLRAEVEALRADARPYTVTCEPVIDSDWPEAHQVRIRNGVQRFDVGMHLETLEEAEHYAGLLRFALGIDAARAAQGVKP